MTRYLSDKQQQVVVSHTVSTKITLNMGLAQGTVLELLLFILYIKPCLNNLYLIYIIF